MSYDLLPSQPDKWLPKLAQGWTLACMRDRLPVAELTSWNGDGYFPVVLLVREARA